MKIMWQALFFRRSRWLAAMDILFGGMRIGTIIVVIFADTSLFMYGWLVAICIWFFVTSIDYYPFSMHGAASGLGLKVIALFQRWRISKGYVRMASAGTWFMLLCAIAPIPLML